MTRHASVASILLGTIVLAQSVSAANVQSEPDRQLLWGDTHLHSSYSMDAYLFQNRTADPDAAYRYAKGYPVIHPYHRARVQIGTPLDFLVISDHAELLGVIKSLSDGDPLVAQTSVGQRFMRMMNDGDEHEVFNEIAAASASSGYRGTPVQELNSPEIRGAMWQQITAAAERHNEPGRFSTLLGWEWSSFPDGANLHRVVITPAGADKGNQLVPFSAIDSTRPEDLWQWLDETSERLDIDFIAIPHNSNISRGQMFGVTDSEGRPQTVQYARTRMRWEPVVEVTQIKGDSETHPLLSPNDEFADFETFDTLLDTRPGVDKNATFDQGSYVRPALLQGMAMATQRGDNPYQFGLIGSTDSHTGLASAEETNFHGKVALDSTPESKDALATENFDISGWDMSAAGLAAVWAEENTRESIFAAFRRREIYATTGPRIRLRFFGGWDYVPDDARAADLAARGYGKGVAMGGELEDAPAGSRPRFLIHAMKDPAGANLDRIQVIKGYTDEAGNTQEKIYNVALSDGRLPGRDGKIEPVGSTVDISSGQYTNDIGATELAVVWKDPEFSSNQYAFYYARVLEIPTPRHTLLDEIALQQEKYDVDTLQERAYSSPIWYTPGPLRQ
jgi:hypothetical protein